MARPKTTASKPISAKHRPAISSPRVQQHTEGIQLPEDHAVNLGQIISGDLQAIRNDGGNIDKFMSEEKFMNELILITINPAGDNENPMAQVLVNNRQFDIPRGRMVRVPRYVVEVLAHAKQATYRTKRTFIGDTNHMAPIESNSFSFPFGVQHDPSGIDGAKWLEKVLNDRN